MISPNFWLPVYIHSIRKWIQNISNTIIIQSKSASAYSVKIPKIAKAILSPVAVLSQSAVLLQCMVGSTEEVQYSRDERTKRITLNMIKGSSQWQWCLESTTISWELNSISGLLQFYICSAYPWISTSRSMHFITTSLEFLHVYGVWKNNFCITSCLLRQTVCHCKTLFLYNLTLTMIFISAI